VSAAAGAAIANVRAFRRVDSPRRDLEMKRDYPRREVQESGLFVSFRLACVSQKQ
jgi:hypothetical protein